MVKKMKKWVSVLLVTELLLGYNNDHVHDGDSDSQGGKRNIKQNTKKLIEEKMMSKISDKILTNKSKR